MERRGPLLRSPLSHDFCNIYMFTLTISMCCIWNNQRRRPGEKHEGTALSPTQLGFHGLEAGPDYARVQLRKRRVFLFLFLQGSLKVSDGKLGTLGSSPSERSLAEGEISLKLGSPSKRPGRKSIMDFRSITKSIIMRDFVQNNDSRETSMFVESEATETNQNLVTSIFSLYIFKREHLFVRVMTE